MSTRTSKKLITGICKEECTGCRACSFICPNKCIEMNADEEGFLYPHCNEKKCTHCEICKEHCHVVNDEFNNEPIEAWGFVSKNEEDLQISTSGAFFSALASKYISIGAYVFGSVYDEYFNVITIGTSESNEVKKMYGSKYVFGDTLNSYPYVKELLDEKEIVLYSGSPCQIAGLKSFLKKEYENLFLIDILCHGGPSSKLFKDYLKWLEKKHGCSVKSYVFRDKKYGRRTISKVTFKDGNIISINPSDDPYCAAFYSGKTYRHSCYACKYAKRTRVGDVTIGDFWGAETYYPDLDVSKGFSAVLINNSKGNKMTDMLQENGKFVRTTLDKIANHNSVLEEPTKQYKNRNKIYEGLSSCRFEEVAYKYMYVEPMWKRKLKGVIPKSVLQSIRAIKMRLR